jgi:hypothetical protein
MPGEAAAFGGSATFPDHLDFVESLLLLNPDLDQRNTLRGLREKLKKIANWPLAIANGLCEDHRCSTERDRPIHLRLGATTPHSRDGRRSKWSPGPPPTRPPGCPFSRSHPPEEAARQPAHGLASWPHVGRAFQPEALTLSAPPPAPAARPEGSHHAAPPPEVDRETAPIARVENGPVRAPEHGDPHQCDRPGLRLPTGADKGTAPSHSELWMIWARFCTKSEGDVFYSSHLDYPDCVKL